jgi:hypothetical protein
LSLAARAHGQSGTLAGLAVVALVNIAYASAGTVVYTINMDWSRTGSAGSDFTIQDSLVHLCSLLMGAAGLSLAGIHGYPRTLGLSVVLGLAGVAAAAWLFDQPRTPRSESKRCSARRERYATRRKVRLEY